MEVFFSLIFRYIKGNFAL